MKYEIDTNTIYLKRTLSYNRSILWPIPDIRKELDLTPVVLYGQILDIWQDLVVFYAGKHLGFAAVSWTRPIEMWI